MEADGGRNQTSVLLEKIRRALGRLSVQTKVRGLDIANLAPPPELQSLSVRGGNRPFAGAQEGPFNSPEVVVKKVAGPEAILAGGSASAASSDPLFHCPISANVAEFIAATPARVGDSLVAHPNVLTSELIVAGEAEKTVRTAAVAPYGGRAMAQPGFLLPKGVETSHLPIGRVALSAGAARKRIAGQEAPPNGVPPIAPTRAARVPQAIAERIPLDRRRLPMPPPNSLEWQAAFLQERQLLAHTAGAGVSFTDIDLVGVYRNVPITAARRLEIEKDTNALLLYLRPQYTLGIDPGQKPVVSIAIGRVKSDGRLVRAVIR